MIYDRACRDYDPKFFMMMDDISSYSEEEQAEIMFNMFRQGTTLSKDELESMSPTEEDLLRYHWETYEATIVQREFEQFKEENPDKIIRASEPIINF